MGAGQETRGKKKVSTTASKASMEVVHEVERKAVRGLAKVVVASELAAMGNRWRTVCMLHSSASSPILCRSYVALYQSCAFYFGIVEPVIFQHMFSLLVCIMVSGGAWVVIFGTTRKALKSLRTMSSPIKINKCKQPLVCVGACITTVHILISLRRREVCHGKPLANLSC